MARHADRLQHGEVDEIAAERDRRPFHLVGGTGIVTQRRAHAADVAERLLDRLADIERFEQCKAFGVRFQQVRELEKQPSALGRAQAAPIAMQRAVRGPDRSVNIASVAARHDCQHRFRAGINRFECSTVGGFSPLAVDEMLARQRIDEIGAGIGSYRHCFTLPCERPWMK